MYVHKIPPRSGKTIAQAMREAIEACPGLSEYRRDEMLKLYRDFDNSASLVSGAQVHIWPDGRLMLCGDNSEGE